MATLDDIFPGGLRLADLQPPPLLPPDQQLRVAMAEAGLTPPDEIIFDGTLRRFSSSGKARDDSGWYVAHDGQVSAGAFGDWRTGMETTWRADIGRELSHIEQMQHASRMREIKAKRERELAALRESAAENASEQWASAPLASDDHPYLKRKGITNHGLRVASDGRLMAPMYIGGELSSLQKIDADGSKRFLKGGKSGGAWWMIGTLTDAKRVYIAEGVATAASIYEATGKAVAIAYSASNMTAVANTVRDLVGPLCEVVVVADHDDSGTGQREGERAAQACGGRMVMPPTPGDANDYAQSGGDLAGLLEPVAKTKTRYTLTPARMMTDLPPTRWQIKKIMPARDVVAIYGPPGAGKSFMALDMAVHIAEGREWMGYRTKPAAVVYLVLEAANGFSGRLKAWQMHHERQLPDDLHIIAHSPFAFSSPADIAELVEAIKATVGDADGLVVFVDTLARAMGAFEENDNNDMGRVIQSADAICRALSCTVALVAHPGKDAAKGLRGGSALLGGLDTVIALDKDDAGLRTWKIEKQKEGEDGITGCFGLHVVPVGIDDDGDEITSAVVVQAEPDTTDDALEKESESLYKSRKIFEDAVISFGRISHGKPFISADAWSEHIKTQPFASDSAGRQALSRAKKTLLKAGYITEVRGGYEATDHPIFSGAFVGL